MNCENVQEHENEIGDWLTDIKRMKDKWKKTRLK